MTPFTGDGDVADKLSVVIVLLTKIWEAFSNDDTINDFEKICWQINVFRNAALVMMINFTSCTVRFIYQVYITTRCYVTSKHSVIWINRIINYVNLIV